MQFRRQLTAAGVLLAFLGGTTAFCVVRARAADPATPAAQPAAQPAQVAAPVLDQVPADALVVLRIKNVNDLNKKLVKMSKELGLDQVNPDWADPLGGFEQRYNLTKGVNKDGELAIAYFDPASAGGDRKQAFVLLVPTSDYKAFVGNLKSPAADGDFTRAQVGKPARDVYVAHRGGYAAVSPVKELLSKKAGGVKLDGRAAKEADERDVLLFANLPAVRAQGLPKLKEAQDRAAGQVADLLGQGGDGGKALAPAIKAAVGQGLVAAEIVVNDVRSATVGLSLNNNGLFVSAVADFDPDSDAGKVVAELKNTDAPLIAGLPDRKYFIYGGGLQDPKLATRVMDELVDPVTRELADAQKTPDGKSAATFVDVAKRATGAWTDFSFGYAVPAGQPGQPGESLSQEVIVVRGDAPALQAALKDGSQSVGQMAPKLRGAAKGAVAVSAGAQPKMVAGVKMDTYQVALHLPEDNPMMERVSRALAFAGARDATLQAGQVTPTTLLALEGASDRLAADAVAAAKAGTNPTANSATVAATAALLPKNRAFTAFIQLDNVFNTGVQYAQNLFPIHVKPLKPLPPIGMTAATEQSALRVDVVIPMDLAKGIMAAYGEMMKGGNDVNGGL